MIFAFIEDGALDVLADVQAARDRYVPVDVESGVVEFYDDSGAPLRATFPHRTEKKLFGVHLGSDPGPYELIPGADAAVTPIEAQLSEVVVLTPNPWFGSMEEVRAHLAARRGDQPGR
jgi:hypothetical protein